MEEGFAVFVIVDFSLHITLLSLKTQGQAQHLQLSSKTDPVPQDDTCVTPEAHM